MRATNQKKQNVNPKIGLFRALLIALVTGGMPEEDANRKAHHNVIMGGGNPIFIPRKHTVMSYAKQNRLAKKRRNRK